MIGRPGSAQLGVQHPTASCCNHPVPDDEEASGKHPDPEMTDVKEQFDRHVAMISAMTACIDEDNSNVSDTDGGPPMAAVQSTPSHAIVKASTERPMSARYSTRPAVQASRSLPQTSGSPLEQKPIVALRSRPASAMVSHPALAGPLARALITAAKKQGGTGLQAKLSLGLSDESPKSNFSKQPSVKRACSDAGRVASARCAAAAKRPTSARCSANNPQRVMRLLTT